MARLPKQEEKLNTYMDVRSINWLVKNRLKNTDPESQTNRVWITILTWYFTTVDGYATGSEMQMGGTKKADVVTAQMLMSTKMAEVNFFVVECKAARHETHDTTWRDAFAELRNYLSHISRKNNRRIFGAIAVGRIVKFYEWNKGSSRPEPITGDDTALYIDRQCQTVTGWLEYIRNNHA